MLPSSRFWLPRGSGYFLTSTLVVWRLGCKWEFDSRTIPSLALVSSREGVSPREAKPSPFLRDTYKEGGSFISTNRTIFVSGDFLQEGDSRREPYYFRS